MQHDGVLDGGLGPGGGQHLCSTLFARLRGTWWLIPESREGPRCQSRFALTVTGALAATLLPRVPDYPGGEHTELSHFPRHTECG